MYTRSSWATPYSATALPGDKSLVDVDQMADGTAIAVSTDAQIFFKSSAFTGAEYTALVGAQEPLLPVQGDGGHTVNGIVPSRWGDLTGKATSLAKTDFKSRLTTGGVRAVLQADISNVVRVKGMRDGSLLAVRTDNLLWVRRAGVGANGTFAPVVGSCCVVDVDELPDGRLLAIGPQGNVSTSTLTMYNTLTAPWAAVGGPAAGDATVTAITTYSGSERPACSGRQSQHVVSPW